jgi:hypothetical protein
MLLATSFVAAFLVWKIQKNKVAKAKSAKKYPHHDLYENEDIVGYETAPPVHKDYDVDIFSPVVVKKKPTTKKKAVTKKTATKKANSSQKKK